MMSTSTRGDTSGLPRQPIFETARFVEAIVARETLAREQQQHQEALQRQALQQQQQRQVLQQQQHVTVSADASHSQSSSSAQPRVHATPGRPQKATITFAAPARRAPQVAASSGVGVGGGIPIGYGPLPVAPHERPESHDAHRQGPHPTLHVQDAHTGTQLFAGRLQIDPDGAANNPMFIERCTDQNRMSEFLKAHVESLQNHPNNPIKKIWRTVSHEPLPLTMFHERRSDVEPKIYSRMSKAFPTLIGVFAGQDIPAHTVVAVMDGYIMTQEEYHNMGMEISTAVDLPQYVGTEVMPYLRSCWRKTKIWGGNGIDKGDSDPGSFAASTKAAELQKTVDTKAAAASSSSTSRKKPRSRGTVDSTTSRKSRRSSDGNASPSSARPDPDTEDHSDMEDGLDTGAISSDETVSSGLSFVGDPACMGSNINDARGSVSGLKHNVQIKSFSNRWAQLDNGLWVLHRGVMVLESTESISAGEELLTDYGTEFWEKPAQFRKDKLHDPRCEFTCPVCHMKIRAQGGCRLIGWSCTATKCIGRSVFNELFHDTCAELLYFRKGWRPCSQTDFQCSLHKHKFTKTKTGPSAAIGADPIGSLIGGPGANLLHSMQLSSTTAASAASARAATTKVPFTEHTTRCIFVGRPDYDNQVNVPAVSTELSNTGPLVVLENSEHCHFTCNVPLPLSQRIAFDASSSPGASITIKFAPSKPTTSSYASE